MQKKEFNNYLYVPTGSYIEINKKLYPLVKGRLMTILGKEVMYYKYIDKYIVYDSLLDGPYLDEYQAMCIYPEYFI